ncbi:FtsX-like permease family protein [Candidatus Parcubacteria bacterium]|nr:FtsX-like permease family protein [Candidatus Parcubacteria bacterium]
MRFIYILKDAFKTLFIKKARTLLTMLGIIIGVAGVIIIVSLGVGAQSLVLSQITKLGSNLVSVLPGASDETGPPAAVFGIQIETLKFSDAEAIDKDPRLDHVLAVTAGANGNGTVVWKGESVDTAIAGITYQYPSVQDIELSEGRFFNEAEDKASAYVTVLGSSVKESLFGDKSAVGEVVRVRLNSADSSSSISLRVVGVTKEKGSSIFFNPDDQILAPLAVVQRQLLGIDHLQFIQAKIDEGVNVKPTIEGIREVLREEHKIKNASDDDFSVRDLADAVSLLTGITDALRLFLGLMASISLVVGGIGIMNIMLVTVTERTREIGLRKAVGARSFNIRMQFLIEAIIITTIGGVIGILVGSLISWLISIGAHFAGFDWVFSVPLGSIFLAVGVSVFVGVVFGYYPAAQASKLDPIESLRYE